VHFLLAFFNLLALSLTHPTLSPHIGPRRRCQDDRSHRAGLHPPGRRHQASPGTGGGRGRGAGGRAALAGKRKWWEPAGDGITLGKGERERATPTLIFATAAGGDTLRERDRQTGEGMDGEERARERRATIAAILAAVEARAPPAVALGLPGPPHCPSYPAARAAFLARTALVHPDKARGEPDAGPAFAALRRAWAAVESACTTDEEELAGAGTGNPLSTADHEQWWAEWEGEEGDAASPGDEHAAWAAGFQTAAALAEEVRALQTAVVAGPPAGRASAVDRLRAARSELAERTRGSGAEGEGGFLGGGV